MTRQKTVSLRATMALAAVLALGSTPGHAQVAEPQVAPPAADGPPAPVLQVPDDVTPPTAAPAIVLPVLPSPAETAVRRAEPDIGRSSATSPAVRHVAARAKPLATAEPVAPVARQVVPTVAESPVPVTEATVPAAPARMPAPPPVRKEDMNTSPDREWEIGLAVLAGIGLLGGGIATAALARRRRASRTEEPAFPGWREAGPVAAPVDAMPVVSWSDGAPAPVGGQLDDGDADEVLLERMVLAAPDAANPFHTRKARRRRARKLLSERRSALRVAIGTPFDWRSYQASAGRRAAGEAQPVGAPDVVDA